jgi:hypothetical protein
MIPNNVQLNPFSKKVWVRLGVILTYGILLSGTATVWAQNTKEKKRTTINFEDQLVEGDVKKPELFFLLQKRQFNFGRLIKLRENFLPEMRRSSEEFQREGVK